MKGKRNWKGMKQLQENNMKIPNYLTILFAVIAILALIFLAGYVTYDTADESNPFRQQVNRILHIEETEAESTASEEMAQTSTATVKAHRILFVGDSRTLGMEDAVQDDCIYLGAEGEGYDWFSNEGISSLAQSLESDPTIPVVINLGVNDPQNINIYIDLYNSLIDQYPDTPFYFMSINPLDEDADFNTTNEMAELFNATLKSTFPDRYLDCYTYLKENGFETVDGLHYTDETYKKIHDYVVNEIA